MMPTVAELPNDVDTLKAMVLATVEQRAAMEAENSRIAFEIAALKLINTTSDARIAELTAIVKTFERMLYGTRSERSLSRPEEFLHDAGAYWPERVAWARDLDR